MSEIRRKMMMQNDEIIPPTQYIQNGLVFQLDGLEKGNTSNAWTDLIGGIIFRPGNNTTELEDGFKFNNGYMVGDRYVNFTPYTNNYTIECVFKNEIINNWGIIFALGSTYQSYIACVFTINTTYNNEYRLNYSYSNGSTTIRTKTLFLSNNSDYIYSSINTSNWLISNFLRYDSSSDGSWTSHNRKESYIGARVGGYGDLERFFIGNIYAIRVYNRKLSLSEMEYNQQLDIERFKFPTS